MFLDIYTLQGSVTNNKCSVHATE